MIVKFRSKRSKQFYFRVVARNGKTVAQSEGYTRRNNRDAGIKAALRALRWDSKTIDLEKR